MVLVCVCSSHLTCHSHSQPFSMTHLFVETVYCHWFAHTNSKNILKYNENNSQHDVKTDSIYFLNTCSSSYNKCFIGDDLGKKKKSFSSWFHQKKKKCNYFHHWNNFPFSLTSSIPRVVSRSFCTEIPHI